MKERNLSPRMLQAVEKCIAKIPKTLAEKVAPEHTAVLVIDVQNDFCHSEGVQGKRGLDTSQAQEMVPRLLKFLSEARKHRLFLIFIRTLHTEWSASPVSMEPQMKFPEHLRLLCVEGTWGAEFYQVSPQESECVVTKYRYSAFEGTELELILRSRGIKTLIVTGVATPVCVESTARYGYMKEFYVVLATDCSAARSPQEHSSAISNITKYFGTVATSHEIVSAWESQHKS